MAKNNKRYNGAPYRKGYGDSLYPRRIKVKYNGFTIEGSGHKAVSDMAREGSVAASTFGMMKQSELSATFSELLGKKLIGELIGEASTASGEGSGNETRNPAGPIWIDEFHKNHQMPSLLLLPYELGAIISCFPKGYEEAMLLHLLSMMGALCFSRVRSKYLDGKMHSPSLQVVVEGTSGAGKGKFKDIFDLLFERVREDDNVKYAADDGRGIIQIIGINTTPAKFFQITAKNQGVHMYVFHPEISHVTRILKQKEGLTYEHFRCAFDNDEVEYNSMAKKMQHGRFRVYMNSTFTGTQTAVDAFIAKEEVSGTAQRICWTTIPEIDYSDMPETEYPEDAQLEHLRDQIDTWRRQFCFDNSTGIDVPCPETIIELGYVKTVLSQWIKQQAELADRENNPARKAAVLREAAIAFHCAMILHMLYDQPTEKDEDERKKVILLTLYLADYCMERYLLCFQKDMNADIARNRQKEQVGTSSTTEINTPAGKQLSPKELYELYHQSDPSTGKPWSYKALAAAYPGNGSDVTIMTKVNNYAANNGLLVRGQEPKRR